MLSSRMFWILKEMYFGGVYTAINLCRLWKQPPVRELQSHANETLPLTFVTTKKREALVSIQKAG